MTTVEENTPASSEFVHELREAAATRTIPLVELGVASRCGKRDENQDAFAVAPTVFAIADGMGGLANGAAAAIAAATGFVHRASQDGEVDPLELVTKLNTSIGNMAPDQGQSGTTLVGCVLGPGSARIVNVGDSRAYRLNSLGFELLTQDHNVRRLLVAAGREVDSVGVEKLGGLTSFLGTAPELLDVDSRSVALRVGDRILLCTDGVHGQLTEAAMAMMLANGTASAAANEIVAASDDAGGSDNATALVLEVMETER